MTTVTIDRRARNTPKEETVDILVNPFKRGDNVVLPAGTKYTSFNPKDNGQQETKRKSTVKAEYVFDSYAKSGMYADETIYTVVPPKVKSAGAGGYWKDFVLTEEIVRLNGKPVEYLRVRRSGY